MKITLFQQQQNQVFINVSLILIFNVFVFGIITTIFCIILISLKVYITQMEAWEMSQYFKQTKSKQIKSSNFVSDSSM